LPSQRRRTLFGDVAELSEEELLCNLQLIVILLNSKVLSLRVLCISTWKLGDRNNGMETGLDLVTASTRIWWRI